MPTFWSHEYQVSRVAAIGSAIVRAAFELPGSDASVDAAEMKQRGAVQEGSQRRRTLSPPSPRGTGRGARLGWGPFFRLGASTESSAMLSAASFIHPIDGPPQLPPQALHLKLHGLVVDILCKIILHVHTKIS